MSEQAETPFFEMRLIDETTYATVANIKLPYALIPSDVVTLPDGAWKVKTRGICPSEIIPYFITIFVENLTK